VDSLCFKAMGKPIFVRPDLLYPPDPRVNQSENQSILKRLPIILERRRKGKEVSWIDLSYILWLR
jgi:hypothetical protein